MRFELLEDRRLLAVDYGDAGGYAAASHEAVGPILGNLRDATTSASTNALANADSIDEDGVVFGALRAGQLGAMTIHVSNAPAGAKLDAWIDFKRNAWNTADDRIASNLPVSEGDNVITFNVPSTVDGGFYYARIRLSSSGNLNPYGAATDGEVEDYVVPIASIDSGPFAGPVPITFSISSLLVTADQDNDGDLDLFRDSTWIENFNGTYGAEATISGITSGISAVVDLDQDSDNDFITTSGGSTRWYRNNGGESFTGFTIDSSSGGIRITAVDLDQDGDLDLLTPRGDPSSRLVWYENDGSQTFTKRIIGATNFNALTATAVDMDEDGDLDVLFASSTAHTIAWYENDGLQAFTLRTISDTEYAQSATAVDLDGDGDLDVLAAVKLSAGVAWYENDGNQSFTYQVIDASIWDIQSSIAADLDGDGDLDVAVCGGGVNKVSWFENGGAQTFTPHSLFMRTQSNNVFDVQAADVDHDGRLDLLASGVDHALVWFRQLASLDYGDAPSPYPVHLAQNGARHTAAGPQLGALRDAEADGTRSPANPEAEDDGVTFGQLMLNHSVGAVTVNVQNAAAGARLDAWIDFNGDGQWGGPGERIFASQSVVEGDNQLAFSIPADAVPGATYARFRLSTAGGLGVTGAAADGEVEDVPVMLESAAPASGLFGAPIQMPSASASSPTVAIDVDRDGDIDVVGAVNLPNSSFTWYENVGANGFIAHATPFTGITSTGFAAGDLDSDGDIDFVFCGPSQLIWAENDGHQNFTRRIATTGGGFSSATDVSLSDLDGDGDQDVLTASYGRIYILVNNGQQQFSTRPFNLFQDARSAVTAADLDGDGDMDIIAGGEGSYFGYPDIVWLQNVGGLTFATRTIKPAASPNRIDALSVGDLDGDGDLDVVGAGVADLSPTGVQPATLMWFEQTSDSVFVEHDIAAGHDFRWTKLADFDADGDLDVLTAPLLSSWSLTLYENVAATQFIARSIATGGGGASNAAAVADLDGDGDLDVAAHGIGVHGSLAWIENRNVADLDYGDAPAPYPTMRNDGGPLHGGGGPRLGDSRDVEPDGAPTPAADGDDDDGVTFTPIRVGQSIATVAVNVQNAPGGAFLDAWIDFDHNGSWAEAGDNVLHAYPVVDGNNTLRITIPAAAVAGTTYARFRISSAGNLRPGGGALDGEVEDYALTIDPAGKATGEFGMAGFVTSQGGVDRVADIDRDGDSDFLSLPPSAQMLWNEQLSDGAFLTHARSFLRASLAGARPVDFDRDGDVDLVATTNSGIYWFENTGAIAFLLHPDTARNPPLRDLFDVADLDGDGDLDVIASPTGSSTQQIKIFLNDGQQNFDVSFPIETGGHIPNSIRAADIDHDGDVDFAAAFDRDSLGWYENDGGSWSFHNLITQPGPSRVGYSIVPIDFDRDGDVDFVSLSSDSSVTVEVSLYRNDGGGVFSMQTLASTSSTFQTFSGGDPLQVADLDADGDYDAVAAFGLRIYVYRNDGAFGFSQRIVYEGGVISSMPVFVGNFDNDPQLEILSSVYYNGTFILNDLPFGDYDRNGVVDEADHQLYQATLGSPAVPPGAGADGDRSGVVDEPDLAIWQENVGQTPTPPHRAANFDANEYIDGADFLRWQVRANLTSPFPGALTEDVDYSGAVDSGDLDAWKAEFGQGFPTSIPPSATAELISSSLVISEEDLNAVAALQASSSMNPEPKVLTAGHLRVASQPDERRSYLLARDAALSNLMLPPRLPKVHIDGPQSSGPRNEAQRESFSFDEDPLMNEMRFGQ